MRILQVITSLHIGGAEKLIVDMVPLYQEQGHQVDVLLFDGTETPFKRQLQDKGVTIYELGKGGSVYNPLYIFRYLLLWAACYARWCLSPPSITLPIEDVIGSVINY